MYSEKMLTWDNELYEILSWYDFILNSHMIWNVWNYLDKHDMRNFENGYDFWLARRGLFRWNMMNIMVAWNNDVILMACKSGMMIPYKIRYVIELNGVWCIDFTWDRWMPEEGVWV